MKDIIEKYDVQVELRVVSAHKNGEDLGSVIAEYSTLGYAQELEIRNEYIFLVNEAIGLEILKVKGLGLEESAGFPILITVTVLLTLTSVFSFRRRKNK